jgi:anti-sigma regulatory factor (Ser/Thr protein kinase)
MHPYAANVPAPMSTRPEAAPGFAPLPVRTARARPGPAPRETSLLLGPVETAPRCARGALREFLASCGLLHVREPAEAITSELVTNAIAASVRKAPAGTGPRPVTFWANVRDGELCIRVWDPDPTPPPRDQSLPDDDAEHGRGLCIVAVLSKRWGYYPGPRGGKFIWAALDAGTGPFTGDAA